MLSLVLSVLATYGQEMFANQLFASGPLVAYAASIAISPYTDLCHFESLEQRTERAPELLIPKSTLAAIFERPIAPGIGLEPSIALTAKKPRQLSDPDLMPQIKTGYGDFFDDDTIGRSRISGAGFQERDYLYFKISLPF